MLLALVPAATLWVGKLLIDEVARAVIGGFQSAEVAYQRLAMLLSVQVGIAIFASLVQTIYGASRELLGDTLQNRISLRILRKAAALDVESFENAETYDALRNAYNEVGSRPLGVMFQLIGIAQALITLASIGSLMTRLGWEVLPLVLLASIPGVIVSSRFGAEGYRIMRRRATDARHQNYLGSLLTSDTLVKEVRLFGFEAYLLEGWQEYYKKFRAQFVGLLKRRSAWGLAATLGSSLLIAFATLSVLRRAAQGAITVGDFSLFIGGIVQIQSQFTGLLNGITGIYESLLYMRNLFEFLELPSRDLEQGEQWRGPINSIEFEHVSFRYPLTDRDVLSDVSFSVNKGQALALVGENGAGKTTVVKLVTRLFEPTSGRILLNGMDAARFSPRSVQCEMSIIFQDYGQYQMTARENIAISRTDMMSDDAAVARASEKSGAVEIVNDLPGRVRNHARTVVPWRPATIRRAMAAARARPSLFPPRVGADLRRADRGTRRNRRSGHDRSAPRARPRSPDAADFASLLDGPAGRSHHRAARGRGGRVGLARGAGGAAWRLREAVRAAGARLRPDDPAKSF